MLERQRTGGAERGGGREGVWDDATPRSEETQCREKPETFEAVGKTRASAIRGRVMAERRRKVGNGAVKVDGKFVASSLVHRGRNPFSLSALNPNARRLRNKTRRRVVELRSRITARHANVHPSPPSRLSLFLVLTLFLFFQERSVHHGRCALMNEIKRDRASCPCRV